MIRRQILPVLVTAVALSGCRASVDIDPPSAGEIADWLLEEEPRVPGSPHNSGLVIVGADVDAFFHLNGEELTFVTGAVLMDSAGTEHNAVVADDIVVFGDIAPGTYHLDRVSATCPLTEDAASNAYRCDETPALECPRRIDLTYVIGPAGRDRLTFEVKAGEIVYGGGLSVNELHSPPFDRIQRGGHYALDRHTHPIDDAPALTRDRESELQTLRHTSRAFNTFAWTRGLKARIQELEAD